MPLQTLCIVHTDASILLGLKKRGLGAGRWNGFGGTVHDGENVKTAAIREVHEETLITVEDLVEVGMLEFDLEDRGLHLEVYVFSARTFTGAPTETDEMRPLWFSLDQIPYSEMWPDDPFWLPLLLQGKRFTGRVRLRDPNTMIECIVTAIMP